MIRTHIHLSEWETIHRLVPKDEESAYEARGDIGGIPIHRHVCVKTFGYAFDSTEFSFLLCEPYDVPEDCVPITVEGDYEAFLRFRAIVMMHKNDAA